MLKFYTFPVSFGALDCGDSWQYLSNGLHILSTGKHLPALIKARRMPITSLHLLTEKSCSHKFYYGASESFCILCNLFSVELLAYLFECIAELLFVHVCVKNEVDKLYLGIINYMFLYSWNFDMNNAKDYFTTLCYKCVFLMCKWSSRLLTFTEFPGFYCGKTYHVYCKFFFSFSSSLYFQRRNLFLACYTIICDSIFTEVLAGTIGLFSYPHKKCLLYL